MDITSILGNMAFILIACSFMVKDILWLRGLSIAASCFSIYFNYSVAAHPLWVPIAWNCFFMSLNIYHVANIIFERTNIQMTDKEQEIFETIFPNFSPVEFLKVMRLAEWKNVDSNNCLINQGETVDNLMLIYNGNVSVTVDKSTVANLKDGQFVGEMSFLTGKPATASVHAERPTQMLLWDQEKLKSLMQRNPSLLFSFQSILGEQITSALMFKNENIVSMQTYKEQLAEKSNDDDYSNVA